MLNVEILPTNRMLTDEPELRQVNGEVSITVYMYIHERKHYLNMLNNTTAIADIDRIQPGR